MTYDIQKEKREAIDAGRKAISSLETARDNLNSAKNWGLVDMFGGGFFTTMIKHSKIDLCRLFLRRLLRRLDGPGPNQHRKTPGRRGDPEN